MQKIVVITDCTDIASNEIKAVLISELESNNSASEVMVSDFVNVREFSVINAAFVSRLLADSYSPKTTTFLVVVNPLDSSHKKRMRLAGRLKNGLKFVGANTGFITLLKAEIGIQELYETSREGLKGEEFISFGGKYVHAPIAAKLAATDDFSKVVLREIKDFSELSLLRIPEGTVLHIDNFGVLKIAIKKLHCELGSTLKIRVKNTNLEAIHCSSMKELKDGQLAVYRGSSLGYYELGYVRRLATDRILDIEIGDIINIVTR
jgi:S-adenosylmethionine hydrolase